MIQLQKIMDTFFDPVKGRFIAVFDVDAPLSFFAGGQALGQTVHKFLDGKMIFRGRNRNIALLHLLAYQPHGQGKRDFVGQLRIFGIHKFDKCLDVSSPLLVQRSNILR